jgi:RNA polymerase sigma-70 factor (ECF subfamily)
LERPTSVPFEGGGMQDERVGLARQGDSEAFGSLIGGVADHLYAIAWRILRDGDRAQDALQQGLIAIWDQLPRLRDPEKFEAWAARVVVHASYREARRDRRWRSTIRAIEMAPAIGASIDPVLDRDQLERAFGRLSPEHRAVLVLHYFDGLSVAEVAETLGLAGRNRRVSSPLRHPEPAGRDRRGRPPRHRACRHDREVGMSQDELFERRFSNWLEDGPAIAPAAAADAALHHARTHPRRTRWLARLSLDRLPFARPIATERDPLTAAASRWRLAFAGAAVVAVVELALIGGPLLRWASGSAGPEPGSPSPTTPAVAQTPSPAPSTIIGRGWHVTSTSSTDYGSDCSWRECHFDATITASDPRLVGCYELVPSGLASTAAWGTIVFRSDPEGCVWPYPYRGEVTWEGVWLTDHAVPMTVTDVAGIPYPIDTVWLSGRGENAGLTAVLHLDGGATFEGWIFATSSGS